ncbi:MAG: phosphoribosylamine--glycine ligase [Anaerolineaceae bacterium]|nr:phosphoribosylamine--glycine ligase [Anaerolineaceae bacterium]
MKKIGLIGDGGREHALARKITESPESELYVAASNQNDGIKRIAKMYHQIPMTDLAGIVIYFKQNGVELVVIGPESTLAKGIVDQLRAEGIAAVGPTLKQAALEGDKSFMRRLLNDKLGWGSPDWKLISTMQEASHFMDKHGEIVVKPVGLTGGRGVRVMGIQLKDKTEALHFIEELLQTDKHVLLEEKVIGQEFSRMAFVCDQEVIPMPVMQDFKYAYDGDKGMMTGGMGVYSFADGKMPFLTRQDIEEADKLLNEVIRALQEETGQPYRGFLYGQFMASKNGIKLIEFNVRLGDPESINVNALLEGDAIELFGRLANGELKAGDISFKHKASVVKYLVPDEYPAKLSHEYHFSLDEKRVEAKGFKLIQASVERTGEETWKALGSRTIAILGLGEQPGTIAEAMDKAIIDLHPSGLRFRKDVGNAGIIEQKTEMMRRIRGL